jgi:hypothetical protein
MSAARRRAGESHHLFDRGIDIDGASNPGCSQCSQGAISKPALRETNKNHRDGHGGGVTCLRQMSLGLVRVGVADDDSRYFVADATGEQAQGNIGG